MSTPSSASTPDPARANRRLRHDRHRRAARGPADRLEPTHCCVHRTTPKVRCAAVDGDAIALTELAANPEAGDVIPGSGGCRKMRWAASGLGKRRGGRVIYYNRLDEGRIWLLVIYTKAVRGDIPAHILRAIKEAP